MGAKYILIDFINNYKIVEEFEDEQDVIETATRYYHDRQSSDIEYDENLKFDNFEDAVDNYGACGYEVKEVEPCNRGKIYVIED